MNTDSPSTEQIARIAHAIWEEEGRPEGRDHEHWMRAKQLLEEGRAEAEYPQAAGAGDEAEPRPVQPGFEDAKPGMVPEMKEYGRDDLHEGPGGRFAKQVADAPEDPARHRRDSAEESPDAPAAPTSLGAQNVPSRRAAGKTAGTDPARRRE
jgi:hypothetical protein